MTHGTEKGPDFFIGYCIEGFSNPPHVLIDY